MICFPRIGDYGRLGNAMFQYSALLGIANKNKYNVYYDEEKEGVNCTLHNTFNLSKYEHIPHWKMVHSIKRIWKEPHFHFCEDAFNLKDDTGLNGYFQSEKYFSHIEDDIRSEFNFPQEIINECKIQLQTIKNQIENKPIVSLHIRLGDYTSLENHYIPLLKTKYYSNAIDYINKKYENCFFIIFSDEIPTCKQLFRGNNILFAEGGNTQQDMCLMSMCDHNIIANSSFSWWGAWLNKNKDKEVIAPKEWFVPNEKYPKDTKDLYCKGWIKI